MKSVQPYRGYESCRDEHGRCHSIRDCLTASSLALQSYIISWSWLQFAATKPRFVCATFLPTPSGLSTRKPDQDYHHNPRA